MAGSAAVSFRVTYSGRSTNVYRAWMLSSAFPYFDGTLTFILHTIFKKIKVKMYVKAYKNTVNLKNFSLYIVVGEVGRS
jgi:hypothetical protein